MPLNLRMLRPSQVRDLRNYVETEEGLVDFEAALCAFLTTPTYGDANEHDLTLVTATKLSSTGIWEMPQIIDVLRDHQDKFDAERIEAFAEGVPQDIRQNVLHLENTAVPSAAAMGG